MTLKKLSPHDRVEFLVSRSFHGVITNLSVRLKAVDALNRNYLTVKAYCDQLNATGFRDPCRADIYRVIITTSFWGLRKNVTVRPTQIK